MASIADGQPLGVVGNWIEDGLLQRVSHWGEHRNLSSKIFTLCEDLFDGRANFGHRVAYTQFHDFRHNGRNRIVKFYFQGTILAKCQRHTGAAVTNLGLCFGLIKIISCPCSTFNV